MARRVLLLASVWAIVASPGAAQRPSPPIIDMHVHANRADSQGPPPLGLCPGNVIPVMSPGQSWPDAFTAWTKKPPCPKPIWSPMTDAEIMQRSLAVMTRRNIIGVASGPLVLEWNKAAPDRIIPGLAFAFGPATPSPDAFRQALGSGIYRSFGEVAIQYQGVEPGDPKFEPYLAIAEELDIPMSIHIGTGPPGAPYLGSPGYRARLHSAVLIEPVLAKHPKLRVSIMHAGWPMLDDLLAVLWAHPQVYADLGAIGFALPRAGFHSYLQRIVEAGFGKRVMFGSDQMVWPEAIDAALDAIESAPFLSAEQKRDILYNNAARFLQLTEQEIARHHGR